MFYPSRTPPPMKTVWVCTGIGRLASTEVAEGSTGGSLVSAASKRLVERGWMPADAPLSLALPMFLPAADIGAFRAKYGRRYVAGTGAIGGSPSSVSYLLNPKARLEDDFFAVVEDRPLTATVSPLIECARTPSPTPSPMSPSLSPPFAVALGASPAVHTEQRFSMEALGSPLEGAHDLCAQGIPMPEWLQRLAALLDTPPAIRIPCAVTPPGNVSKQLADSWLRVDTKSPSLLGTHMALCLDPNYFPQLQQLTPDEDAPCITDSLVVAPMMWMSRAVGSDFQLSLRRTKRAHPRQQFRAASPAWPDERDSNPASSFSFRPDIVWFVKGLRLLCCIDSFHRFEDAARELSMESAFFPAESWGDVWFHFAAIVTGTIVQFVAVVRGASGGASPEEIPTGDRGCVTLFRLGEPLNVTNSESRLRVLARSINVFRTLRAMDSFIPDVRSISIPTADDRKSYTVIPAECFVRKSFPVAPETWEKLKVLYNRLKQQSLRCGFWCKNLVRLVSWSSFPLKGGNEVMATVTISPIATKKQPETEAELRDAVRSVLKALTVIHAQGFGHCDVRWSNVMFLVGRDWILIDLECAEPFGAAVSGIRDSAPEAVCSAASDVFMVGGLLDRSPVTPLPPAVRQLVDMMLSSDPKERPTVSDLLNDPWLACDIDEM